MTQLRTLPGCTHLSFIRDVRPSAPGCEDCLRIGSWWVHLRLCMTCGHVGCCDSSPNRHASAHAPCDRPSDHPLAGTGRGLDVVLRRRGRPRGGLSTSNVVRRGPRSDERRDLAIEAFGAGHDLGWIGRIEVQREVRDPERGERPDLGGDLVR